MTRCATATRASGHAERLAAEHLLAPHADRTQRVTVAGDKGFGTRDFVAEMREINVTPHVARNDNGRRSGIDGPPPAIPATPSACAFASASRKRSAGPRRSPVCARGAMVAYNLVRLPKLLGAVA